MMEDVRNDGSNGKACPFNDWTTPADLRINGDMGVCNFHLCLTFKKNMCRAMMSSERGNSMEREQCCPKPRQSCLIRQCCREGREFMASQNRGKGTNQWATICDDDHAVSCDVAALNASNSLSNHPASYSAAGILCAAISVKNLRRGIANNSAPARQEICSVRTQSRTAARFTSSASAASSIAIMPRNGSGNSHSNRMVWPITSLHHWNFSDCSGRPAAKKEMADAKQEQGDRLLFQSQGSMQMV